MLSLAYIIAIQNVFFLCMEMGTLWFFTQTHYKCTIAFGNLPAIFNYRKTRVYDGNMCIWFNLCTMTFIYSINPSKYIVNNSFYNFLARLNPILCNLRHTWLISALFPNVKIFNRSFGVGSLSLCFEVRCFIMTFLSL